MADSQRGKHLATQRPPELPFWAWVGRSGEAEQAVLETSGDVAHSRFRGNSRRCCRRRLAKLSSSSSSSRSSIGSWNRKWNTARLVKRVWERAKMRGSDLSHVNQSLWRQHTRSNSFYYSVGSCGTGTSKPGVWSVSKPFNQLAFSTKAPAILIITLFARSVGNNLGTITSRVAIILTFTLPAWVQPPDHNKWVP